MDRRIETVRQLVENNLKHNTTLRELAGKVNLSPSRLGHLFKTETGLSLGRYIKRARVEAARHLLETSFLSVKQIMVSVGFNDVSHFVRCFKDAYGHTPKTYRNSVSLARVPPSANNAKQSKLDPDLHTIKNAAAAKGQSSKRAHFC